MTKLAFQSFMNMDSKISNRFSDTPTPQNLVQSLPILGFCSIVLPKTITQGLVNMVHEIPPEQYLVMTLHHKIYTSPG